MLLGAAVDPDDVYVSVVVAVHLWADAPAVAIGEAGVVYYYKMADGAPTNSILPYLVYRRSCVLHVLSRFGVHAVTGVAHAPSAPWVANH